MSTMKLVILTSVLVALTGVVACNDKNTDDQQASAPKAVSGQQAATQKPADKADVDEGEEGVEGPAHRAPAPTEKPALQQPSGKQFIYNFDSDTPGQPPAKFHAGKTGAGAQEKW